MRVVYLSAAKLPSAAANTIHIVNMCQAYREHGCGVILIVSHMREKYDGLKSFYGIKYDFDIEEVGNKSFLRKSWRYVFYVLKRLRNLDVDLVHGRFLKACFFVGLILGKRVFFEIHHPVSETRSLLDVILFKLGLRHSFSKVVLLSHSLARLFIKCGVSEDKLLILHDGSTDHTVKSCKSTLLRVGYAGKLDTYKGKKVIDDLAVFLKEYFRSVELFVSGRGVEKFVLPSKVKDILSTFDVCLLPLQGRGKIGEVYLDFSSPLKLFDYMSVGGCIVASKLSSVEEVLDGKNGVLVSPYNLREWRRVVSKLLMLPSLRKRLGAKARSDFIKFYTWKRRAGVILKSAATIAAPMAPVN